MESDDSLHTTLLIETMAYEMEQSKVSSCDVNSLTCNLKSPRKSYSDVVKKCRQVKEVNGDGEKTATPQQYRVESPEAEMINEEEWINLEKSFSEEEIKEAIMSSYASGLPGQMGCVLFSTKTSGT